MECWDGGEVCVHMHVLLKPAIVGLYFAVCLLPASNCGYLLYCATMQALAHAAANGQHNFAPPDLDMMFKRVGILSLPNSPDLEYVSQAWPQLKIYAERPDMVQAFLYPVAVFLPQPTAPLTMDGQKARLCTELQNMGYIAIPAPDGKLHLCYGQLKVPAADLIQAFANIQMHFVYIGKYGHKQQFNPHVGAAPLIGLADPHTAVDVGQQLIDQGYIHLYGMPTNQHGHQVLLRNQFPFLPFDLKVKVWLQCPFNQLGYIDPFGSMEFKRRGPGNPMGSDVNKFFIMYSNLSHLFKALTNLQLRLPASHADINGRVGPLALCFANMVNNIALGNGSRWEARKIARGFPLTPRQCAIDANNILDLPWRLLQAGVLDAMRVPLQQWIAQTNAAWAAFLAHPPFGGNFLVRRQRWVELLSQMGFISGWFDRHLYPFYVNAGAIMWQVPALPAPPAAKAAAPAPAAAKAPAKAAPKAKAAIPAAPPAAKGKGKGKGKGNAPTGPLPGDALTAHAPHLVDHITAADLSANGTLILNNLPVKTARVGQGDFPRYVFYYTNGWGPAGRTQPRSSSYASLAAAAHAIDLWCLSTTSTDLWFERVKPF